MSMTTRRFATVTAAVVAALAAAGTVAVSSSAEVTSAGRGFGLTQDDAERFFFPAQPPDWAGEARSATAQARDMAQIQRREIVATEAAVLRQAAKAQACIAERVPGIEFSPTSMVDHRAQWTTRVLPGSGMNPPPAEAVYQASKECHELHLRHAERAFLADAMPHGRAWFQMRDEFLGCLGVDNTPQALVEYYRKSGDDPARIACEADYWMLFELPESVDG